MRIDRWAVVVAAACSLLVTGCVKATTEGFLPDSPGTGTTTGDVAAPGLTATTLKLGFVPVDLEKTSTQLGLPGGQPGRPDRSDQRPRGLGQRQRRHRRSPGRGGHPDLRGVGRLPGVRGSPVQAADPGRQGLRRRAQRAVPAQRAPLLRQGEHADAGPDAGPAERREPRGAVAVPVAAEPAQLRRLRQRPDGHPRGQQLVRGCDHARDRGARQDPQQGRRQRRGDPAAGGRVRRSGRDLLDRHRRAGHPEPGDRAGDLLVQGQEGQPRDVLGR